MLPRLFTVSSAAHSETMIVLGNGIRSSRTHCGKGERFLCLEQIIWSKEDSAPQHEGLINEPPYRQQEAKHHVRPRLI